MRFRDTVKLFQDKHNGIGYKAINVLAWPNMAKEFSVTTPQAAAFVVYKGQKAKAQELSEQEQSRNGIQLYEDIYFCRKTVLL